MEEGKNKEMLGAIRDIERTAAWRLSPRQWHALEASCQQRAVRDLVGSSTDALAAWAPPGTLGVLVRARRALRNRDGVPLCTDPALQSAVAPELQGRSRRNGVGRLCERIGSFDRLMSMDRDLFDELRGAHAPAALQPLRLAFLAQGGDPAVVARSPVPGEVLRQLPDLGEWPARLGRWLGRRVPDPEDREHLMRFLRAVDERLYMTFPHRSRLNSRQSLVTRACVLFGAVDAMRAPGGGTFRDAMPFDMDGSTVQVFLARLVASWRAQASPAHARRTAQIGASRMVHSLLGLLKTAARAGVFPLLTLRRNTFHVRTVEDTMRRLGLVGEEPEEEGVEGAACGPPRCKHVLQDDEVQRLRAAATSPGSDPRDGLLMALLVTTGLRLQAIASIGVHQLWDRTRRCVQPSFVVAEKNSERRCVVPCRELREAIERFATSPEGRTCECYAFGRVGRVRLPPTKLVIRRRLHRVCDQAGVPRVNPHAFRAYLITRLRRLGVRPEVVSKFIGHRSPQTQNEYYWKEDVETVAREAIGLDAAGAPDGVRSLQRRLKEAQERLLALHTERDRLAGTIQVVQCTLVSMPP